MCGRYVMARAVGDLLARFDAELEQEMAVRPSWNIAPTTAVPVVLERLLDGGVARQLHLARWGLIPPWAKEPGIGAKMINARSETVLEKPAFREAVTSRRCAVPADGYYEWKGSGKGKQPYYVRAADDGGMVFAGVYEWWRDLSKAAGDPGRWVLSTSILTTSSTAEGSTAEGPTAEGPTAEGSPPGKSEAPVLGELAALHDRVPVAMSAAAMDKWLSPGAVDAAGLVHLVRSQALRVAAGWRIDPVGPAVGSVRNDSAELIQRVEPAGPVEALF
jgi:putative SOS response-associated peptidase YedK